LWENAAGGHDEDDEEAHEEIAEARAEWEDAYGDAARLLLDKLKDTLAITEDDELVRLTPLALAALHEQLVEAGVEIPLLPQTAAELSGAELLALAGGGGAARRRSGRRRWRGGPPPAARPRPPASCSTSPPPSRRASGCSRWPPSPGSASPPRPPGGKASRCRRSAPTRRSRSPSCPASTRRTPAQ